MSPVRPAVPADAEAAVEVVRRSIVELCVAGEIQLCCLRPGAQHRGHGKALLQGLEAQAKAWGLARVRLRSTSPARAFYEHHGYRNAGDPERGFGITWPIPYAKDL